MKIKNVGITGAGIMGSGIAQIFKRNGYNVKIVDINDEALDKSKELVRIYNESLVEEGIIDLNKAKEIEDSIIYSTDLNVLADSDLVIEAIVEKIEIKQKHWQEIEKICSKNCYFATNTSGLSINEICLLVEDKTRFVGTHFWNPPHLIPLVELIRNDKTSDETLEVLMEVISSIDKEGVIVKKDAPGFIGNRIQFAIFREAMHIVNEGIADAIDVDKAMKYGPGFRYPVIGPLETADLGGLDTFYYISSYLFNSLTASKDIPKILKDKIDSNKLGVKSKEGFYDYSAGKDAEIIKRRDRMFFKMLKYIHMERE